MYAIILFGIFFILLFLLLIFTRFKLIPCSPSELLCLINNQFDIISPIDTYCVYNYIPMNNPTTLYDYLIIAYNTTLYVCGDRRFDIPGYDVMIPLIYGDKIYGIFSHSTSLNRTIITGNGTIYPDTWIYNFDMEQVNPSWAPEFKIHKGYENVYSKIRDQIHIYLQKYSSTDITLVGASLGGSLMTITALDLYKYHPRVFSFAAPRCVDPKTAKWIEQHSDFYRIYNTEDIVPSLPISVFNNRSYSHVGKNIPFTINLGSHTLNHNQAYNDYFVENPTPI